MIDKFSKEYIDYLEKNKLLPLKETAKMLNMHPATLRSIAKSNSIKHVRIGKKYYFNAEDIKNSGSVEKRELPNGVILNNGYIKVNVGSDFPGADANGYIPLHKLVVEAYNLKRIDTESCSIKHKDSDLFNNKITNLEIKNNAKV